MFGIDTNLLVYAHNTDSGYHESAMAFLEKVMNERDENGRLSVCVPVQVLMEFIHVITWQRLERPLSLAEALQVVGDYIDSGIIIVHQRETQLQTFLDLLTGMVHDQVEFILHFCFAYKITLLKNIRK